MTEETKNKVMGKINEIKSNIESFISDVNVHELKASFNNMVKDAQKDFNKLVEKDIESVRSKLQKEKADIEKKAKKFLDGHKKELSSLQGKIDKLMKAAGKLKKKSTVTVKSSSAPTTKKKVMKKVAKATPKKGFAKKTTARKVK